MAIIDRLDPAFAERVAALPAHDLTDLQNARRVGQELRASWAKPPPNPLVEKTDHVAPARDDHPAVRVRMFRPIGADGSLPLVYWIQGGGYVLVAQDLDDDRCEAIVGSLSCAVVAVEWRRAPEHRFPAAIEDCYTGLAWVVDNAGELRIDPDRIVVAGQSSGGGKAACLALLVHDRAEFSIAHQLLVQPMLDDRNCTPSSYAVTDPPLWNRESNEIAWRAYLGDAYGTDCVSEYAAPARRTDLSGVAPATILTSELDLFCDEDVTYAQRLMQAEVPTELHVYPRVPHGFWQIVPEAEVSRHLIATRDAAFRRALFG
jgi:acetyl esterase/lipase